MVEKMTKWWYLSPFRNTREKLHLLDISRKLSANHATTRKYLNDFVAQGVLKKETRGRLTLYQLNESHPNLITILTIVEKELILSKCQNDLKLQELVSMLQNKTNKFLLLFGSSTQNLQKASDIDILTLDTNLDMKDIEQKLNLKIHLIAVDSLNEIKPALKEEIFKKHLLIQNIEEALKWLH